MSVGTTTGIRSRVALAGAALIAASAGGALLGGCQSEDPADKVHNPGPLGQTFAVSEFFTPSGHMGDGQTFGHIVVDVLSSCRSRPPGARGDCYRFTYHPGDVKWAGVYWVYPANNWGSRHGRRVVGERFQQVRVQAASLKPNLLVNFLVGRINDPALPNRDDVGAITTERIGTEWKTIRLPIDGQQFDEVVGAFAWSLAYPADADGTEPVVLFIDDLVWDTEPIPSAAGPKP